MVISIGAWVVISPPPLIAACAPTFKMTKIFIPGNVPSSKNSKQWTGKFLVHSKTTQAYVKKTKRHYKEKKADFYKLIEGKLPPYTISFKFVRGTKHRFDYHNAIQIVADLMQECEWLEDDNADYLKPCFEDYEYDK